MSIVPSKNSLYNDWKNNTNNFLQSDDPDNAGHKQYERLGLSLAEATGWDDETQTWNLMYGKYKDPNQKTLPIIHQTRALRLLQTKGGRGLSNRIRTSGLATEQDATIFHFVLTPKKPEKRYTPFKEAVIVGFNRLGSGEYDFQFRYNKDTKRPSLLPGADQVEISAKISATSADPATVDPEGDGFRQRCISKARYIYKSGTANKGKFLLIAFRWNYSKNPDLAGPWSEVMVMAIY